MDDHGLAWAIAKPEIVMTRTAHVMTDELTIYMNLPKLGYKHEAVNHGAKEYIKGDIHTQNIEGLWGDLKRGVYDVYRIVSKKYLQAYADEYAFRYNHRNEAPMMFDTPLKRVSVTFAEVMFLVFLIFFVVE